MTVEDGDGSGGDQGLHCSGLLGVCTDGQEALPVDVFGGGTGAVVVQAGGGDLNGFNDGGRGDAGVVHGGRGRDDGDDLRWVATGRGWGGGSELEGEDLVYGEVLRREDAVEPLEGERTLPIEEVGDVGLLEAGLVGEAATGEGAAFDAPEQFKAEKFMQVLEVHKYGVSRGEPYHLTRRRLGENLALCNAFPA